MFGCVIFIHTALLYRHQRSYRQQRRPSNLTFKVCQQLTLPLHPPPTPTNGALYPLITCILYLALLKLVLRTDSSDFRLYLSSSFNHFKLVIYNLETLFSWPCFFVYLLLPGGFLSQLLFIFVPGKNVRLCWFHAVFGDFSYLVLASKGVCPYTLF